MSDALQNVNILSRDLLPTPRELVESIPVSERAAATVMRTRDAIQAILERKDPRLFVIVGPCSIHDLKAATEYAERLRALADKVSDTLLLVMRVYFEKPRTSVGWKGFINDPRLDDSFHVDEGLRKARGFLQDLGTMGVGVATEALDPITPQYLGDLVGWSAIGARTSQSQTHRDLASGLSCPVGFKNGTDGNIDVAINALKAVTKPQHFLGVTDDGRCAVFRTSGNRWAHLILRGGGRPNYDSVSVTMATEALRAAGLDTNLVVDCSHGNSLKQHAMQPLVLQNCVNQIRDGNRSILGFMLESHLHGGRQDIPEDLSQLRYGVSITDACMDWETTANALREARSRLAGLVESRSKGA